MPPITPSAALPTIPFRRPRHCRSTDRTVSHAIASCPSPCRPPFTGPFHPAARHFCKTVTKQAPKPALTCRCCNGFTKVTPNMVPRHPFCNDFTKGTLNVPLRCTFCNGFTETTLNGTPRRPVCNEFTKPAPRLIPRYLFCNGFTKSDGIRLSRCRSHRLPSAVTGVISVYAHTKPTSGGGLHGPFRIRVYENGRFRRPSLHFSYTCIRGRPWTAAFTNVFVYTYTEYAGRWRETRDTTAQQTRESMTTPRMPNGRQTYQPQRLICPTPVNAQATQAT
ncbi:hypothetical protein DSM100685_0896 [Bifidobacterium avesanii]|nr:hypothetical protein DSM100685_0896 [Bifidobacterium avesanii]